MSASLALVIMSASFFNPSFALSSHFDSDGAPLSELSWSSSLAVVAVSFSGLFTFIFLMLVCLCCKRGDIGFKEFENADGEDYPADMSTQASPASHAGPDVYILPLTEVSLPVAKQPGRSVQLLRSTDLGRHSLLYIKEIGHGWFGKVLLGEVHSGLSCTQVVVKELKSSASVQDQMHFLEEARPYWSLHHPALVQCLAQCTEVTPYLLVMEICPLGDVKGYLRSCRATDSMPPDPLLLQRMACEITSGLLHLHKNNFTHSDLALRNCLLTSDINVKIGDYGLSQKKYKDDYFVTSDQTWIPLRWIAPELVDEVHGNLLVVDQTKESNIWSLGVTIWELFELGNQPYRHYSDRQVLSYAVKDQQLKLPKPLLKYPLADRCYEVMQFCWLQPDQRPTAEEVHLLLSYLCAKGASEAEEDFERRWNSMRPNTSHADLHEDGMLAIDMPMSSTNSSFPLLEQFPSGDGYHSESGDDILTVTETSHGLNFEYKWEQARAEQHYHSSSTTCTLGQGNPHCQEIYYPPGGMVDGCAVEGLTLGVSPSYFDSKHLHTPGVVPVLSAHSPSVGNEYYIRIEEPVQSNIDMNFTVCSYSPEFGEGNGSFLSSGDSGECINSPSEAKPADIYWSAEVHKCSAYDSDTSPAVSLTTEPILGHESPLRPWESGHYVSYKDRDVGYYYEPSPPKRMDHYLIGDSTELPQESWGSRSLRQALGELEDPLGVSPSLDSPSQGYTDPYLENIQGSIIGKNVTGGYYDMMGSLRKTMPGNHSVCINMASGGAIFVGRDDSDSDEDEEIFVERQGVSWSTRNPENNNTRTLCQSQVSCLQDSYADFHYTMPMTDVEDTWPEEQSLSYHISKPVDYLEATVKNNSCLVHGRHVPSNPSPECNSYMNICHEPREAEVYPVPCCQALSSSHFVDPLTGTLVRNCFMIDCISGKSIVLSQKDQHLGQEPLSAGHVVSKIETSREGVKQFEQVFEQYVDIAEGDMILKQGKTQETSPAYPKTEVITITPQLEKSPSELPNSEPESELSKTVDSGVDRGCSSISLVEIDDCSDDDITDVTSGIFADFAVDTLDTVDYANPTFKSLQKQVDTPDLMDSIDIPSTACSSETLSPASVHPSSSPKTVDSGYDTENNESPEFVPKEPHEIKNTKAFIQPSGKVTSGTNFISKEQEAEWANAEQIEQNVDSVMVLTTSESSDGELKALSDKTPYRDSAYFSDYDVGKEKESEEDTSELEDKKDGPEILHPPQETEGDECPLSSTKECKKSVKQAEDISSQVFSKVDEGVSSCDPAICYEFFSAPDNEVSTIEDHVDDENLWIDSDRSAELVPSESQLSDSNASLLSYVNQEDSFKQEPSENSPYLDPVISEDDVADNIEFIPEVLIEEECINELDIDQGVSCVILSTEDPVPSEDLLGLGAERSNSSDSVTLEDLETTNKDPEEEGLKKRSTRSCSPPPPQEGWVSPTDGEEADEEDGDSEDSDESDEELRTYRIQEQSEESEDEILPVTIIVSDCSDAHKLRSLLKMPTLLSDSLSDEMETKKKVVTFFDDVTVFLFDQESPTSELADQSFILGGESSKPSAKGKLPNQKEKVNISDDSSDGNISEESAGFEWEDDFPLLPLPTSTMGCPPHITSKLSLPTSSSKPAAQVSSRFTVSPSNVSRFSITHVSDSDMDSAGGSSEDGERE
ncbi:serine/threonine-protein kinase LMTK1-like isoform X3 [Xyrauchen texanus]|uniref:serine/threonine-protein kinase LMTK1-like isoform X3 n=3 Tax=Xyrauchen texanus TaxID=154827 RepID=UPI00224231CB|nr:serine/threonine-protein kinase LMTK1-like isoform X3 [Xyrauchen texanus]